MTTNMPQQANGCVLLFMGIIFAVAGFSVIYWGAQEEYFTCYRSNNVCIMEKKKIFDDKKEKKFQLPLSSIKNAVVKSQDDNDGVTYRAYLVTEENKIPLSSSSSSDYSGHLKKAQKVNSYINSKEEKLEIIDKNTIIKVFGGVFFGVGILMLLGAIGSLFKLILALFFFITGRR